MAKKAPRTIWATGRSHGQGDGFTLLELLIVLSIMALFAGAFVLRFDDGREEELLTTASGQLCRMAHQAKRASSTFRRDQFVVLRNNGFYLTEREPLGEIPAVPTEGEEWYELPGGVDFQILAAGEAEFTSPGTYAFRFRQTGLNDPLQARFSMGSSFVLLDFNALTGQAETTSIYE